ncbi:MAG: PAS domain S-box protein, partial [archaeon]
FKDVESRRIKKDGTQIIVSASGAPILDKEGSLLGYRGIETDITERKMVEENIRQLSQAAEQSPATIVITDTEGLIEYTNPKFSSLTGYTAEEAKGQNPKILKAGDMPAEHYKTLWDTIKAGSEWRGEMHNKKKNEELYWEYASVSPIKNAAGNITHFLAVKEDITERKKLESALQETQEALLRTSKIKDEFLSITSHDLKSPLGIVKTSMSLLLDESDITPATKEYAALSLRQANKGLKLISDLLDLKKLETGDVRLEPTKFHFARLIDEILHDFGKSYEQADVSLSASSDDDYEINADYNKVGQVISNLLGNALKFTSKGGSVKINTSLVQKQDVDKVTREYLKVSVSDTGIGIPEDKIKKIFEKYEQASSTDKKIGTGLGLAIAKYVCGLHHGEIWVESKVGQGSNFIFILPYSKEIQELYYDENSCLPYKILIVDDMDDQRFITKSLLRKGNFHSEEASNWRDALDKIRTNNFSLVLLDIEMPDINGYELLEIIRREKTVTELPVIMYSSKQIDNDRCNHLGVSCFILKERAADELVAQIRRTLGVV